MRTPDHHDLHVRRGRLDRHPSAVISTTTDGSCRYAVAIKRGIQTAVVIVAHHRKVIIGTIVRPPGHYNLSVRLDRYTRAIIIINADGSCRYAVAIKRGIQTAFGVIAHHGKIIIRAIVRLPGNYYLSVKPYCYCAARIITADGR